MAALRAVKQDEKAAPKPPETLKAAAGMSERVFLVAMRTKIAGDIDNGVPSHALAPLMRQLREIDREIRALDLRREQEGGDGVPSADEALDQAAL